MKYSFVLTCSCNYRRLCSPKKTLYPSCTPPVFHGNGNAPAGKLLRRKCASAYRIVHLRQRKLPVREGRPKGVEQSFRPQL